MQQTLLTVLASALGVILLQTADAVALDFQIGQNFTALSFVPGGSNPPDTMGAVGPNHIASLINGRFSVFDKTGNHVNTINDDTFWLNAGVQLDGPRRGFDPRLQYDPHSQRWFAVALDEAFVANNFLVAVSSSSDPTGPWTGFKIDSGVSSEWWADYPMLGMNGKDLTVVANMYRIDGATGWRTNALVLPKADLLAATPTVVGGTLIQELPLSPYGFSPHPVVDMDNGSSHTTLLAGFWKGYNGTLQASRIVDQSGTPGISFMGNIPVTFRNQPPPIDQPGNKPPISTIDARFGSSVVMQNGVLWAVQCVDFNSRAAIEWYKIRDSDYAVLESGLISDSELGFNFPSIAVNDDGDVVIGFSGGGPNTFMSTFAVVGETLSGSTSFGPVTLLKAGVSDYEKPAGTALSRWGDYSATVLDPVNDKHFWTFQEFVSAENIWSIQVTEIVVPEPSAILLLIASALAVVGFRSCRKWGSI